MKRGVPALCCAYITALCLQTQGSGTIEYVEKQNAFWARGWQEHQPAQPADLEALDARLGLGKVTRPAGGDTLRVAASLWIGGREDAGTWFQVGSEERPRETLLVEGTVWIRQPRRSILRRDGRRAIVNRLRVGRPDRPDITPRLTLLYSPAVSGSGVLNIGRYDPGTRTVHYGGDLHVFHGVVDVRDSATGRPTRARSQCRWYASELRLVNSTVAGLAVTVHSHVRETDLCQLHGTSLLNGNITLMEVTAEHCTFRGLKRVLRNQAVLVDCTLGKNDQLVYHTGRSGGTTVLIDTPLDTGATPLRLEKNDIDPRRASHSKRVVFPSVEVRRSLQVKVTDSLERPIDSAWVRVRTRSSGAACSDQTLLTDTQGLTPEGREKGFSLLIRRWTATRVPTAPQVNTYAFTLMVWKQGHQTTERPLDVSDLDQAQPLGVTLPAE